MARRRSLAGRPLLLASAGLVLGVGCGPKAPPDTRVGNLMAPPHQSCEICVDVTPDAIQATVTIDGVLAAERCTHASTPGNVVVVEVSAPGFATETRSVDCVPDAPPVAVELAPGGEPDLEPPVGNLMAPPQE